MTRPQVIQFVAAFKTNTVDKPKLLSYQFAVRRAEFSTGHILKNDNTLFLLGDDILETYEILNSFEQAKEFSVKKVHDNSGIECCVYDYNEQLVFVYNKNGERTFK